MTAVVETETSVAALTSGDSRIAPPDKTLADDILRGVMEIAAFLGLDERQCYYVLQSGAVPAFKEKGHWVSLKSRLRRHYAEAQFQPEPKQSKESPPDPVARPPTRKAAGKRNRRAAA